MGRNRKSYLLCDQGPKKIKFFYDWVHQIICQLTVIRITTSGLRHLNHEHFLKVGSQSTSGGRDSAFCKAMDLITNRIKIC